MEIFVVAEDDRRALPRREREQRRAHRFVRGDVSVGVAVAELGGPAFEVGALDRAAPEEVRGQVDDRSAEVAVERLGVAQVVEAAHESKERFLDEILGERPVARQEVGEPEPGRGRPLVDLASRLVPVSSAPMSATIVVLFAPTSPGRTRTRKCCEAGRSACCVSDISDGT